MPTTVNRTNPASGDAFLVVQDGSGNDIQPVAVLDTGSNWVTPAKETTQAAQGSFGTGAKSSISTAAVQMTTTSLALVKGVTVKAASTNTGSVFVGTSSAVTAGNTDATDGFELLASQAITLDVNNQNLIWLIASTAGQKVYWAGV